MGVELGISYFKSNKNTITNTNNYDTVVTGLYPRTPYSNYTYSSNMIKFNPSFVLTAEMGKISPYAKFGLLIGLGSIDRELNQKNSYLSILNVKSDTIILRNEELSGGIALGFTAGVGLLYKLNETLSLFGELSIQNLNYAPTNGEVTVYTKNGVDKLSSLTTLQKEIEYLDDYTLDSASPLTSTQVQKQKKVNYPFSSFNINLGIRYSIK
jgi:hypothetical protein